MSSTNLQYLLKPRSITVVGTANSPNNNGYIVVLCKNKNEDKLEEDYIDLLPILDNLYIESAEFLAPIKKVEVSYD